jgi:hypothetical protein
METGNLRPIAIAAYGSERENVGIECNRAVPPLRRDSAQRGRLPFVAAAMRLSLTGRLSGGTGRDGRVGVVLRRGGWIVLVPTAIGMAPVVVELRAGSGRTA